MVNIKGVQFLGFFEYKTEVIEVCEVAEESFLLENDVS